MNIHTNINAPVAPVYFVEVDFGKGIGRAFRETDRDRSSWEQVVADIVSGEIEKPVCVLEVYEDERSCRPVTADIARDVHKLLQASSSPCPDRLRDFIDEHVGLSKADELDAEGV